jgi:hypothetical protein
LCAAPTLFSVAGLEPRGRAWRHTTLELEPLRDDESVSLQSLLAPVAAAGVDVPDTPSTTPSRSRAATRCCSSR